MQNLNAWCKYFKNHLSFCRSDGTHFAAHLQVSGQTFLPPWQICHLGVSKPPGATSSETPCASPSPQLHGSPARPMWVTLGCPLRTRAHGWSTKLHTSQRRLIKFLWSSFVLSLSFLPEDDLSSRLLFPLKTCDNCFPQIHTWCAYPHFAEPTQSLVVTIHPSPRDLASQDRQLPQCTSRNTRPRFALLEDLSPYSV